MEKNRSHILVVDDDDKIRSLIKEFLIAKGFIISTAIDSKDAKSKIEISFSSNSMIQQSLQKKMIFIIFCFIRLFVTLCF